MSIEVPYNESAEQEVIGALLTDNNILDNITIRKEFFYVPAHQRIYEAIEKLILGGKVASPNTLKSYFSTDEDLRAVGGPEYITSLLSSCTTLIGIKDVVQEIGYLFMRRELIRIGLQMSESAIPGPSMAGLDPVALIEKAEKDLFSLASGQNSDWISLPAGSKMALNRAIVAHQNRGKVSGVSTGLKIMDEQLGGLHPSDLLIIAGRPSMGKTALATNIAFNVSHHSTVAFFSLEMSAEQISARIQSSLARVSSDKVRRGQVSDREVKRLHNAHRRMSDKLFIDDTPGMSVMGIRTRARRLKRQHGLGLIVVDYLQLMTGNNTRNSENRVQEISEITRGLKAIAKELEVPVIALSQLSRQTENRDNKKPQLSDLRESGSIEQDADVVMFVYREEYYLSREEPTRKTEENESKFNERYARWQAHLAEAQNVAETIIAKQRHGPIGTIRLRFDANCTLFEDLDKGESQSQRAPHAS